MCVWDLLSLCQGTNRGTLIMWDDQSFLMHEQNRTLYRASVQVGSTRGKHQPCYLFWYSGTTSRRAIARVREV